MQRESNSPTAPQTRTLPWWCTGLPLLSIAMQSAIHLLMDPARPLGTDPGVLSFVCLVPWVLWIVAEPRDRRVAIGSYVIGVVFYLTNTQYLMAITAAGYVALSLFFGLYYWLFAVAVRRIRRRWHAPLTFVVPVVWVATEYLRSIGPLALPLLFLSHGTYRLLPFIQVADLVGASGVSFVVAAVNGLIVDLLRRQRVLVSPGELPAPVGGPAIVTLVLVAATVMYGVFRLNSARLENGPRVAVIQGDYPLTVSGAFGASPIEKRQVYFDLMTAAMATHPDMVVLPETPWAMLLNDEFLQAPRVRESYLSAQLSSRDSDARVRAFAGEHDVHVVIGAGSMDFLPHATPPNYRKYNSAFVFAPDTLGKQRYDKVDLVMFGEYTPFRFGPFHSTLYTWLDSFNPFSSPDDEFSLSPGPGYTTFPLVTAEGRTLHFGIPICFEDLIPRASRAFARGSNGHAPADFLLSISNDGWFDHGAVVAQHLAVCAFRAVENRVGIARSVNTACSGFIDPDGTIHDLVDDGGRVLGRNIFGFSTAAIKIDRRQTVYSRWGDWFSGGMAVVALLGLVGTWVRR